MVRRGAATSQGTARHSQGGAGITSRWKPAPLTSRASCYSMRSVNPGVALSARSELRRRWGALSMLALLLCVGGGSTLAAAAGAHRTQTAFGRMLRVTRQPTISVTGATDEGFSELDPQLLDQVMRIDGVKGATEFAFMAVAPAGTPNFFTLAVISSRGETPRPLPLDGATPDLLPTLDAGEVVLNEAMKNELHKRTGDSIELESYSPETWNTALVEGGAESGQSDGPRVTVRVAGVFRSPEDVSDAPDPFFLMPPAFYERYHDTIGNCACDVQINADPSRLDAIIGQLQAIYPQAEIGPTEDLGARVTDTVALQRRGWWVIAIVAGLATAAALYLATRRVNRLLMTGESARSALGMTARDRRLARLLIIAPAMLVGTAAAIPLAYMLSPLAPVGLTRLAEPHPGLLWDPIVVLTGAPIVAAVAFLIATASTRRERVTSERLPSSAMAMHPQIALGNRLALGPGRGAMIGVLLAVSGVVGALTMEHSLHHVLDTPALFGADFDASNLLSGGEDKRSLAEKASSDPDVEAAAVTWSQLPSSPPVQLSGPGGQAEATPRAFESIKGVVAIKQTRGHVPGRPDEVAMGQALMDELGVSVGDRVSATGDRGTVDLTVVGDDLDPGVDVAGEGLALTTDGLSRLVDTVIDGAVIRFAPGIDRSAAFDRYATLHFTPVTPPSEILHIGQLGGLPSRVGQLLTMLAIIALVNAIVLGLRLARRDIALHRALGFTSSQVVRVHLWAALVIATTGVVVGGVIGFVVGRAIERQLVTDVGAVARTVLPTGVAAVAGGAVVACLLAGLVMSGFALRHRPGAELRAE
jgi:hypothetical protein